MSANIASLQTSAGSASQLLANGPGTIGANGEPVPAGPFAALFQQLLGQQSAIDLGSPLALQSSDTALSAEDETDSEQLTALLPFLEAMGLATPPQQPTESMEDLSPQEASGKQGAVSTVISATQHAATANSAVSESPRGNVGEIIAGGTGIDPSVADTAITDQPAQVLPGNAVDETANQTGNDFKAQLNSAMLGGHENAQTNGQHAQLQATHGQIHSERAVQSTPLAVNQPVGGKTWGEEVGNHVVWMANRQESRAELVLTPPQMGRVEVSLTVTGDQATATFVSGNPAVRDALESALPRLREILADSGIQLGQAQVGAESFQQSQQSAQQAKNGDNSSTGGNTAYGNLPQQAVAPDATAAASLKTGRGLVDVFA